MDNRTGQLVQQVLVDWKPLIRDILPEQALTAVATPFDLLSDDPPIRVFRICVSGVTQSMLLVSHHIALDGASVVILRKELHSALQSICEGRPIEQELHSVLQMADFAAWQNAQSGERSVAYWKESLNGAPHVLTFSGQHPRPDNFTHQGGSVSVSFPAHVWCELRQIASQASASPVSALHAIWSLLLQQYTLQNEVMILVPVDRRKQTRSFSTTVGNLTNMVALRIDTHACSSLHELLTAAEHVLLEALHHSDASWMDVVEAVLKDREGAVCLGASPLAQTVVQLLPDSTSPASTALQDIYEHIGVETDLQLLLCKTAEGGLEGSLVYYSGMYTKEAILHIAASIQSLMTTLIANPSLNRALLDPEITDGLVAKLHKSCPPPPPVVQSSSFHCTRLQLGYILGMRGSTGSHVYLEIDVDDVDCTNDVEKVLNALVARHDMLRAIIELDTGKQRILPNVPYVSLHAVQTFTSQAACELYLEQRRSSAHDLPSPYDISSFPSWKCSATRMFSGGTRFHIDFDLVTLGGSLHILAREFSMLYVKSDATLPPVQGSFREFCECQESESQEQQLSQTYWTNRLHLIPPAPMFPAHWRMGPDASSGMLRFDGSLPQTQWHALQSLAKQLQVSDTALVIALFCEVLREYSEEPEVSSLLCLIVVYLHH